MQIILLFNYYLLKMEINNLENNKTEDDQGPFLTSDVKEIFKKRKEEKNKKGMKKIMMKRKI